MVCAISQPAWGGPPGPRPTPSSALAVTNYRAAYSTERFLPSPTKSFDVLVVGAGPAGAIAALNLAPFHSVLLIDAIPDPIRRIGECLLPSARPLLTDMGLFERFQSLGFPAWHATRSVW